jgi:dolichol kinase
MGSLKEFLLGYEFKRKLVHILFGVFIVYIQNISFFSGNYYFQILALASLIIILILSLIVKYTRFHPLNLLYSALEKPDDFKSFPGKGAIYYAAGVVIAVFFFDRQIASASILILAFGDTFAHFIGRYYGKTKLAINPKKLLEGTIAGIVAGTIAASFFVPFHIAFFGAFIGMIAEAVEIGFLNLDDNFFIPFAAGLAMKILFMF